MYCTRLVSALSFIQHNTTVNIQYTVYTQYKQHSCLLYSNQLRIDKTIYCIFYIFNILDLAQNIN